MLESTLPFILKSFHDEKPAGFVSSEIPAGPLIWARSFFTFAGLSSITDGGSDTDL